MPNSIRQLARHAAVYAPRPVIKLARYPREWLFANGHARFHSDVPSVLFFTTHKCASMLMLRMLVHVNKRLLGLTHLNMAAYLWDTHKASGKPVRDLLAENATRYFQDHGILYAPLRSYFDISHLSAAYPILMLRDPRDVLVSGYYSARYSHRPPVDPQRREAFLQHRRDLENISVEDYTLMYAPRMLQLYDEYREHLPRKALLTYEQMWGDFPAFAARLARLLGVEFDAKITAELQQMAAPDDLAVEDVYSHRRKGVPGDYKDKLSPAVADRLSRLFSDTLSWMDGATP